MKQAEKLLRAYVKGKYQGMDRLGLSVRDYDDTPEIEDKQARRVFDIINNWPLDKKALVSMYYDEDDSKTIKQIAVRLDTSPYKVKRLLDTAHYIIIRDCVVPYIKRADNVHKVLTRNFKLMC